MDKTYVFDNAESGCGNSGMMGLVASLCNQRGLDPNMVMAMMGRNGNGFGDGNGSWIWVVFLFFLMGWGRNGFGGFGSNGQGEGNFLAGQLANDTGRELLQQAIAGNAQAISQLASTLNCDINAVQGTLNQLNQAICNVGNQVGLTGQQVIAAINAGNCQLATQISSCCCDLRDAITRQGYENQLATVNQTNTLQNSINFVDRSIERGFSATNYATADQTCQLKQAIADSTAQILAGQKAAEFREIQREVQALRDERTQYQMSALIQQQSQNIINTVRPCPTPAFLTCNPWGCNGGFYGNGYPYGNNGCGNSCGGCGNGCGC